MKKALSPSSLALVSTIAADHAADDLQGISDPAWIVDITKEFACDSVTCYAFIEAHPELQDDAGAPVLFAHSAELIAAADVPFEDAYRLLARAYGLPLTIQ
jgi:hypothetical protein